MRVSSIKGDPGYPQWSVAKAHGKTVKVYLDGVEQTHCSVADTDQGFVKRCVLNEEGRVQVDPNDPEMIWTERAEGNVRVEFTAN